MSRHQRKTSLLFVPFFAAALLVLGCSANPATTASGTNSGGHGGAGTVVVGTGGSTPATATGGTGVNVGGATPGGGDGEPFGCATSLSGTVFDPAGKLPLYNVVVYVPSEALAPISEGASCQTCDGNFSGRPIAAALSDAAGKFTIDLSKIPRSSSIRLVTQVGKWRREINVPDVKPCTDNALGDGSVRLPRDRAEGNLPKIAVVRGGSDALECLFRKIGIADSEFSTDSGDGRVTLYASDDGSAQAGTTELASGGTIPLAGTLYANYDKLKSYDVVFLACEGGGRGTFDKYGVTEFTNIQKYADEGGRIFGSHYHNYWIRPDKFDDSKGLPPYPAVAKFASSQHGFDQDVTGDINATFPKGEAFRDWLANVGASPTPGKLLIHDGEHTVDSVIPGVAQPWVTVSDPSGHTGVVQYFSFTAPVGKPECGRMVFSDLHVASGTGDSGKVAFPNGCVSKDLSPQEKALAFMLFDLSSCVQPEDQPVKPPTIIR
jgi:hypothetical protein